MLPIIAVVSDVKLVANLWLRSGNTVSAEGFIPFLEDTFTKLQGKNLTLSAADVWRLYRGHGDAENRIKELKYDFGFDSFNMQSFFGTEAVLIFAMLAYNLMALFRQVML